MRVLFLVATAIVAAATGCSSPAPAAAPHLPTGSAADAGSDAPTITSDVTWQDGTQLTANVVIGPAAKVTIAPGATIHASAGVQIAIQGTLQAAGGAEATITSSGTWVGLLVETGGTLSLANVDLTNAAGAIAVNAGALGARYDSGTITASGAPFAVQAGATLTTAHAAVKGSLGTSRIQGELDASYLDYDSAGADGITAESDSAVLKIDDSELHGTAGGTTDMIVSYLGAQRIHVSYTEIKNVHCAFHIERVSNIDVSFVTATSDAFGAMLYGSLKDGTRTFDSVNLTGELDWAIDEEDGDINGPIAVTNSYIGNNAAGDVHLQTASNISVTSPAAALIATAHPR